MQSNSESQADGERVGEIMHNNRWFFPISTLSPLRINFYTIRANFRACQKSNFLFLRRTFIATSARVEHGFEGIVIGEGESKKSINSVRFSLFSNNRITKRGICSRRYRLFNSLSACSWRNLMSICGCSRSYPPIFDIDDVDSFPEVLH